jgi:methylated-DNA-[protein]-cysteine S-methyltransferase
MVPKSGDHTGFENQHSITMASPVGMIRLISDGDAIKEVHLVHSENTLTEIPVPGKSGIPTCLSDCRDQLLEYFEGRRQVFDLPLAPDGTEFQQRVWQLLLQIPFGATTSYAAMAKKLGDPKVIRAAASANGKNPIAIIIPCHRVIGSNGELVGYAGGLPKKKWLLEHERQIHTGISQLSIF